MFICWCHSGYCIRTLSHLNLRSNELWTILGLRESYCEDEQKDAMKEWDDWGWFVDNKHPWVVSQLNQRLGDKRLILKKTVIRVSRCRLARFLAKDGASTRTSHVEFRRAFRRVRKSRAWTWCWAGLVIDFELVEEVDYLIQSLVEDEVMGQWLVHDGSREESCAGREESCADEMIVIDD